MGNRLSNQVGGLSGPCRESTGCGNWKTRQYPQNEDCKLKILVSDRFSRHDASLGEFLVVLRRDNWDDFGFKTLFDVEIVRHKQGTLSLGQVKILRRGMVEGPTPLPSERFNALDENYCSLGQDIEYYEKLAALSVDERSQYLESIRDAAIDISISSTFSSEPGWQTSLLRFGQAEHTLRAARNLLSGEMPSVGVAEVVHRGPGMEGGIRFHFDDSGPLPGRTKVLIGYNGVGKTRLLAEVARETSKVGQNQDAIALSQDSTFAAIIAVSYSAFDKFELPLVVAGDASVTTSFGYTYCGLRRLEGGRAGTELKSIDEVSAELMGAFNLACARENKSPLVEALTDIQADPSFGRVGLKITDWIAGGLLPLGFVESLSAGQKIVVNIVVQLAAHLRTRSLVLVDEPETHLHPPLLAALLRGVQKLLDGFDSFAIVATHSPVVLQEVSVKDVQIIERFYEGVRAISPQFETFGAGLTQLTYEAFGLDNTVSDYRAVIRQLARSMSIDEIEEIFPMGLSSQARALVLRAAREAR